MGFVAGEWNHPFPKEKGNSLALGLVESFYQSDNVPPAFYGTYGEPIEHVVVEVLNA